MEANFVIFYIENSVDERRRTITAFFPTYDAALEGIKDCADWWRPNGTGRIYSVEFGLNGKRTLLYEND